MKKQTTLVGWVCGVLGLVIGLILLWFNLTG